MTRKLIRRRMVLISFHLPPEVLQEIDTLVTKGLFPSRSEFFRFAIRSVLEQYYRQQREKKDDEFNKTLLRGR